MKTKGRNIRGKQIDGTTRNKMVDLNPIYP